MNKRKTVTLWLTIIAILLTVGWGVTKIVHVAGGEVPGLADY